MKPLSAVLFAVGAATLAWFGMRYLSIADAFGARALHGTVSVARGPASLPQAAVAPVIRHGKPSTLRTASSAVAARRDEVEVAQAARRKLAALRAPLSPEAQNDPFGVLSWLPPPPPPAPVPEAAPAPAPVAPPLPFAFVGMSNANQEKPQVFLADGDQLLIVSPGDVIDGRYRFESIAATAAVFTYLPLDEKQVMAIGGEGN